MLKRTLSTANSTYTIIKNERGYFSGMALLVMLVIISCASNNQPSPQLNHPVITTTPYVLPSVALPVEGTVGPLTVLSDWNLIFADEFATDQLDKSRWVTCYWWVTDGCTILSNNELEWYQPDNVSVSGGKLILEARKQIITGWNGQVFPYTSGLVSTGRASSDLKEASRFSFQYGYVEIRAKIPAGQGLWPAFWMLPITHESRPEIDIMEILGHYPERITFHTHYLDSAGTKSDLSGEWIGSDFSQDWHTFGVDWQSDHVTWYVDGVERFKVTDPSAVPSEYMYIILNLAVGGDWPGAPDASTLFPNRFEIDYVHVYQHR